MKILKNKFFIYFVAFLICGIFAFLIYTLVSDSNNDKKVNNDIEISALVITYDDEIEVDYKVLDVEINGVRYTLNLEDSKASYDFFNMTPIDIVMDDLDGNKKIYYLGNSISSELDYVGLVSRGDVMLYNNDNIIICYKDFEATSLYTKLGHIDNLPIIDEGRLEVLFVR